jgi:hypothetical protein
MSARRKDILRLMHDPKLLGAWFNKGETWRPWEQFLAIFFNLAYAIDDDALALFRECTGRTRPLGEPYKEAWILVGRRGGKSIISALIACFLSAFFDYRKYLAPGERASVLVLAGDKKQARVVHRYIRGFFQHVPMLRALIESEQAEALHLTNRVSIEICVSNPRGTRGYTVAACICDEIATWPSDEFSPDRDLETLAAVRPAMLTIPNALLIAITSPYARKGATWETFRKHYGQDDSRVLVWQAPTLTMNPGADKAVIDAAYADDPESASAEYGAQFRSDIAAFISAGIVASSTMKGAAELLRVSGVRYLGAIDAAGGSGSDSMTLAVAHHDRATDCVVLDCLREVRPPFSPESVCAEFAKTLKSYGIGRATADRWGSEFVREAFLRQGISLQPSDLSKSDAYLELLPLLNSNKCRILDQPRLISQLCGLERRTARGGKDSVDHGPNQHDDLINSAALALVNAKLKPRMIISDEMLRQASMPGWRPGGGSAWPWKPDPNASFPTCVIK